MRVRFPVLVVLAMSLTLSSAHASSSPTPGVFRMKLGDFEVVALEDAQNPRPLASLIANPEEIPKARVAKPDDPAVLQVNAFLVNTGSELVLFDSGNGGSVGRAVEHLKAAGYRPEQVTTVLLTHLHGDHVGGMVSDGKPTFANAKVFLDAREAAFWIDPEREKTDSRRGGMQKARESLAPYAEAGRLIRFDGVSRVVPGITAVPAYGHTPGHTAYMLESKGRKLLVWGDIIHLQQLQLPNPDISLVFDIDAAEARETRRKMMAEAAAEGYAIAGVHMKWPGIGRVRNSGGRYVWDPAK